MTIRAETGYLAALRRLPVLSAEALLGERHLLVVAPHPDDESLGAGGLLAAAHAQGTGVSVVFLTDGEASHVDSPTFPPDRLAMTRRREAIDALAALGIPSDAAHFMGWGDSRLPFMSPDRRAEACAALLDRSPGVPTLVCVTADSDPHGDHQAASALVRAVAWPPSVEVMHFPVWTWRATEAELPSSSPSGFRVDISAFVDAKRAAIAAHRSQHGGVIADAVEAFELDPAFVGLFLGTTETYLWPR